MQKGPVFSIDETVEELMWSKENARNNFESNHSDDLEKAKQLRRVEIPCKRSKTSNGFSMIDIKLEAIYFKFALKII